MINREHIYSATPSNNLKKAPNALGLTLVDIICLAYFFIFAHNVVGLINSTLLTIAATAVLCAIRMTKREKFLRDFLLFVFSKRL